MQLMQNCFLYPDSMVSFSMTDDEWCISKVVMLSSLILASASAFAFESKIKGKFDIYKIY